ncbi:hypothetical protein [Bythopirellula polymerisocia]|uniref:Uncharacterized protein n=1 Tax=Bythopirellula polymerisocia TaxID=2528003 RepID=A0A5C6CY75_9BACT|nr:hypothetical protein [Bythopirellula polymerisocia]TWU29520.1 hypothetical protein Pla144_02980 [Bythopirellula polymerisocia]
MFYPRPLTWLFIIATLCVDLALVLGSSGGSRIQGSSEGLAFFVYNYGLPAQISALAIWAVLSRVHRLAKAAWVTLAGGMLLVMTWLVIYSEYRSELVAYCFLQLMLVLVGCFFLEKFGWIAKLSEPMTDEKSRFQFSLVEIFGWTIIVAFWAFAVRFADFAIVTQKTWWIWLLWAALIPLVLAFAFFKPLQPGTRLLRLMVAYLFALLLFGIARIYDQGPLPSWAFAMAITQITYITAWWAVMRMDEVMGERRAVTTASREALSIYDPTKSEEGVDVDA